MVISQLMGVIVPKWCSCSFTPSPRDLEAHEMVCAETNACGWRSSTMGFLWKFPRTNDKVKEWLRLISFRFVRWWTRSHCCGFGMFWRVFPNISSLIWKRGWKVVLSLLHARVGEPGASPAAVSWRQLSRGDGLSTMLKMVLKKMAWEQSWTAGKKHFKSF